MIYWDIKQRTAPWFELRLGKVTSSRLDDLLAKARSIHNESERRINYRCELISERISHLPVPHGVSPFMLSRYEIEPVARCEYELRMNRPVREIGLATHPKIPYFAASTDGLVADTGVLEIKCPGQTHHTRILTTKVIDEEWMKQIRGELSCTEREWCDFVSYCQDMPAPYDLYIQRVYRDEALIRGMESEVICFLDQVETAIQTLEKDHEVTRSELQAATTR